MNAHPDDDWDPGVHETGAGLWDWVLLGGFIAVTVFAIVVGLGLQ